MKHLIALAILVTSSTAWAHRPHIVDCQEFARIAQQAAEIRDSGRPLQDAMAQLNSAHRYDNYIGAYRAVVTDVYTDANLKDASPVTMYQASEKSCLAHNDEERRTMRLY